MPWSNNEYLADLLPTARAIRWMPATSREQASDDYGRLIVDWATGGFRLGGAVTA